MFIKKLSSGTMDDGRPKSQFPLGTVFIQDSSKWTVIEEIQDTDADWRRIRSGVGEVELLVLKTLQRDLKAEDITFVQDEE